MDTILRREALHVRVPGWDPWGIFPLPGMWLAIEIGGMVNRRAAITVTLRHLWTSL
jgi:hypothetical protein